MNLKNLTILLVLTLCSCAPASCDDPSKEKYTPGGNGGGGGGKQTETVVWHQRAFETYQAIERLYGISSGATAGFYNENYPKGAGDLSASYLWPYDGLMSGLALLNKLGYDVNYKAKIDQYQAYWRNSGVRNIGGYGSTTDGRNGGSDRFYDDNSIIGINLVEAYKQLGDEVYLERCSKIVDFLADGEDNVFGGALWWCESNINRPGDGNSNKPACANGYAQWFLLSYYDVCPETEKARVLALAKRLYAWEYANLRDPEDNVYWNDKGADGNIHTTKWTYNSGAMIAAGTRLYHITGEKHYLDEAKATADGAYNYYVRSRSGIALCYPLNDPWFTVKLVRAYMELEPDYSNCSRYIEVFVSNLEKAWTAGRKENGLFYENWTGVANADRDKSLLMQDAALESLGAVAIYKKEHK